MIEVSDLASMDRAALIAAWAAHFAKPAPKGMSRSFLRRFLAVEIQNRQRGGASAKITKALSATRKADTRKASNAQALKPGGRLLREWNGVTHVVEVTETGFLWNGETWRSLSAIARAITGAHWSGPRFFGLTGKATK